MRNIDDENITEAVIARTGSSAPPRLRQVMSSLLTHLHAFARETKITEEEWTAGIEFLTATGKISDDKRQEFILLSDTLGLSTLVDSLNNRRPAGCTESTVFGPFFVQGAPHYELGADIANGAKGAPCFVKGQVRSLGGNPIPTAKLNIWQADEDGFYDVQYANKDQMSARGQLRTDKDGRFYFRSILAEAYPIPHDGPVGKMLEALGRHPWRPAHLHFMIEAPGYQRLITHVFRNGDRYLDSDAVFGVRSSLIADWVRHEPGIAPDGTELKEPFYSLDYDFILNPQGAPPLQYLL